EMELAQKFGIMSIPNVILFHKGEIADNSVGVRDKNFYASKLQTAIDNG
ncbi:MAG: thioredoxin, partial [Clostridia bacterium]|nr:thioredoxin [Clostridia bacterium]